MKLVLALAFSIFSFFAIAEEGNAPLRDLLIISKATGMCGTIQQMVAFQESTKMDGGDEFITRFVSTEAARLGQTVPEFVTQCESSITVYTKTIKALNETD